MIWHFLEVWGLLIVAFAAGCALGTLLYMALAASPLAEAQVATADSIVDALNGVRWRGRAPRNPAGYRPPPREEPYMALPPLAAEPLDYPGPGPVDAMRDSEPVALSAEGMDDEGMDDDEALEAEREEEPYWDEEQEDFPPLESEGPPQDVSFGPFADVDLAPPPMPAPEPEPVRRQDLPAMRPLTLPGPRNGVPDNLQRIRGIGQKNEELLNSLGVYHFGQIAAWTPAEARWIASHLAFPERIERDDWIGQAIVLATGGDTGYVKAADRPKGGEEPPVAA